MVLILIYCKEKTGGGKLGVSETERVELSWEQSEVKKGPESWGGVTPLN